MKIQTNFMESNFAKIFQDLYEDKRVSFVEIYSEESSK